MHQKCRASKNSLSSSTPRRWIGPTGMGTFGGSERGCGPFLLRGCTFMRSSEDASPRSPGPFGLSPTNSLQKFLLELQTTQSRLFKNQVFPFIWESQKATAFWELAWTWSASSLTIASTTSLIDIGWLSPRTFHMLFGLFQ